MLISVLAFLIFGKVCFAEAIPRDFLGYQPLSVERVLSRSCDESWILYFVERKKPELPEFPGACDDMAAEAAATHEEMDSELSQADERSILFFRQFKGRRAQKRCQIFHKILEALSTTGVAPYLVRSSPTSLVVTFVEGEAVTLECFSGESTILPLVMRTLERFYKALEVVKDELPKRTLVDIAYARIKNMHNSDVKRFLRKLIEKWKHKFLKDLQKTTPAVVHGDLHASNMIQKEGRLWLLDYGLCGRGYVIEDLARLSLYSNLTCSDEAFMLKHWFHQDECDEELSKLFSACKVMAIFVWALVEMQHLSEERTRAAVFSMDVGDFNEARFAHAAVDVERASSDYAQRLLAQAVKRLKNLFEA